jgi:hypothetical protein
MADLAANNNSANAFKFNKGASVYNADTDTMINIGFIIVDRNKMIRKESQGVRSYEQSRD